MIRLFLVSLILCSPLIAPGQNMMYYALVYEKGASWNESESPQNQAFFKEHSVFLNELRKSGKIALGARYGEIGLVVIKVESEEEAIQILDEDISVKNKTFKVTLFPFSVFFPGNISIKKIHTMSNNAIKNFQIPVIDFDRALSFYSQVMDYELQQMNFGNTQLGIFRFNGENGGVGGTIIKDENLTPSKDGTMVYLDAGNDLQPYLNRVENAGGTIAIGKTSLGPGMGYFAIFIDSEGNKVGLYSKE